jgi:hypothetical protein
MPGERTLYRKMQVALEVCASARCTSVEAVIAEIMRKDPINFRYSKLRADGSRGLDCSEVSVTRAVNLCVMLGLIAHSGRLTRDGVSATDHSRFGRIVGSRVTAFLEGQGMGTVALHSAIRRLLARSDPVLPTADSLWLALGQPEGVPADLLRSLLYLLGIAGLLVASQRRIYLPRQP